METDIVGAAGNLVVVQVLEVIDSVVTAQGHMNVGGQEEVSVLDRTIASDSGILGTRGAARLTITVCNASKFPLAGCVLVMIVWVD
ncbi:hypothetical protein Pyn_31333 [Prunus yedoensis var. nudiflora]|uniref:Uncharacterized protein n=1 Tax=Prunus yedoensis var. nudiflora TaxID=2094558 RepID=A0A314YWH1_PRUYE|nr:hypothetical protein Pyn_31333 [Prunus yedoensis var. nudiflora]